MSQGKFPKKKPPKTHDYTQLEQGSDYVFEALEGGEKGHMTGQGKGMKQGDYVLLPGIAHPHQYQVDQIDYYCNSPDMWIALLKKVSVEQTIKD